MNNKLQRKSVHFTSDWHVYHANSIVFDKRPFNDIHHMHRVLINNYNAQVPEDGVCYFGGDMGFGSKENLRQIIEQLNGTKVLILGNHDKQHNQMYDVGFDVVLNSITLFIANKKVTMSHCPLRGVFREDVTGMRNSHPDENWHGEKRHHEYTIADEGQYHLHGHIHSGPANNKPRIDGRQLDVGVCANKYRPVSISEIESFIARNEQRIKNEKA